MTEEAGADAGSAERRARREFIRTHHPDAGGEQQTFITGLANLDAQPHPSPAAEPGPVPAPDTQTPVTVTAWQPWPVSLTTVMLRRLRRHRKPRVR